MRSDLGTIVSAFTSLGFKQTIAELLKEVVAIYESDRIPWVVGYSGGKDSTAVLQLIWLALSELPRERIVKPVYVISTDTLVENPVVALWVSKSLKNIETAARKKGLPITTHRLTPEVKNSFWVNLIGRGYPAPRPKFRWCTERLKIQPSSRFIRSVVQAHGEAILVLGSRKAESRKRAQVMEKFERRRVRSKLSPNSSLPNSSVYTPLEDWSNDDVWLFLMQIANPWGYNNKDLLTMYQGASADGECPLVVDTTTPSCGDSRFGCWVCTLVEKDKSMQAMIQNDEEKQWMLPLLELRNELDPPKTIEADRSLRDFRRMNGAVQLFRGRAIPGPYKQDVRADWLRKILRAQCYIREHGPNEVSDIELISLQELEEIRRIWVVEKHEIEDDLPRIYEETTGEVFLGQKLDDNRIFGTTELEVLRNICGNDDLHYQLMRELLSIEKRYKSMMRRRGLFEAIDQAFKRHYYVDEDDAIELALSKRQALEDMHRHAFQYSDPMIQRVTEIHSDDGSKLGQA